MRLTFTLIIYKYSVVDYAIECKEMQGDTKVIKTPFNRNPTG